MSNRVHQEHQGDGTAAQVTTRQRKLFGAASHRGSSPARRKARKKYVSTAFFRDVLWVKGSQCAGKCGGDRATSNAQ